MNIHHLELFYCVAIHGGISEAVRKQYPELGLSLRSGYQPQIEDWLRQNAIDLAAIALSSRPAPPLNAQILKALPPVILALESSP
jgi:DNA-binding transcriptional LysR family regulator